MKPATAEWLERMRLKGKKPAMVIVEIDGEPSDWFGWRETWAVPVLAIQSGSSVDRLDLRSLIGLNVVVIADRYTEWLASLYDAMKSIPVAYVALCIRDWATADGDVGIHWSPSCGDVSMLEPCS